LLVIAITIWGQPTYPALPQSVYHQHYHGYHTL